ncbi:MAG: PKD domain-containing protein [Micromonosporaceae bacterium]
MCTPRSPPTPRSYRNTSTPEPRFVPARQGGPYPYLADLGAFSFNINLGYSNITPTTEGTSVGITNSFDVCCWHDEYVSFPPFLRVLATNASTGRAAAIGGLNVVISEIQLAPPAQTLPTGATATVQATVSENGTPVDGATVNFQVTSGPNTGLTGTVATNASGVASFSYSSGSPGTDTVQASFVDSTGDTQQSNLVAVTWEASNRPPLISAGGPYTGYEGTPLTVTGSASDPDGDALSLSWTYSPGPGVDSGATCTFGTPNAVSTTFECTDDGTYYVTLTGDDGNGAVSDSVAASVLDNLAPSITSVNASTMAPVPVGTAISVVAPFTDPGVNDTHTCDVDWGDGSPVSTGAASGGSCGASHTYTAANIYTVSVTVTDDDGASDTALYQYVVVYDPSAGFVTGGGWIDSPAGAYPADPSLTGRANFGFVSKYKRGATVPDGQTQFQLHTAGLNFHSTSYDWLVVSGPKAQYKGSGTINGTGDYGFLLTANDGQTAGGGDVDRFRIKIWDKSTGTVIYDNQLGAGDTETASDAIEGGSIVIHAKK